jgi:Na+/melibiose symporter-like transporter
MTHTALPSATADKALYRCGTLTYTKAGLFFLFAWLLWGDFCLHLVGAAMPSVLQVNLNSMGAPNWVIGLVLSTIPGILNMTICPATSFWSDRFRSRWGRRIPFLFLSAIPLSFFLLLLGYSRQIGEWLHGAIQGGFSQTAVILTVLCVFVFFFQVFNMVVSSVYYYLFNDVVPVELLARFVALFRVVGVLAGAAFNWFCLKYAADHMTEIFAIIAILFGSAFMLMCWKVKEGAYPPPPAHADGGSGPLSGIKTFFIESFSLRFYWLFFLANTCFALTNVASGFLILQARSIGVDLDFFGKITAVAGVVSALLMYPAGILADRLHPLRVLMWATVALLLIQPLWLIFLFYDFSPSVAHGIFIGITAIVAPATALYMAADFPMYMRILPKSRFGQFSSANAIVRSVAVIIGGLIIGFILDHLAVIFPVKDYCYRFVPVWSIVCTAASLFFLRRLYADWLKRGGLESYVPPGFEADEKIPTQTDTALRGNEA